MVGGQLDVWRLLAATEAGVLVPRTQRLPLCTGKLLACCPLPRAIEPDSLPLDRCDGLPMGFDIALACGLGGWGRLIAHLAALLVDFLSMGRQIGVLVGSIMGKVLAIGSLLAGTTLFIVGRAIRLAAYPLTSAAPGV